MLPDAYRESHAFASDQGRGNERRSVPATSRFAPRERRIPIMAGRRRLAGNLL
jgi:hypothetical protein